jgi:hypothetical protein
MFLNAQTMVYMAHNKDKSVTCAYVYGKAVQSFMAFLVTGFIGSTASNSTGPFVDNQYAVALVINLSLGFILQNAMRGQTIKSLPALDFSKHGNIGYYLLVTYAVNMIYFLSLIFDNPYKRYGKEGALKEVDGDTGAYGFAHYFTLLLGFVCGDIQFFFEYGSSKNVSDHAKFCIWRAIAMAFWLNDTKAAWEPQEQLTAVGIQAFLIVAGIGSIMYP